MNDYKRSDTGGRRIFYILNGSFGTTTCTRLNLKSKFGSLRLIAATALAHGLTVAARNRADFVNAVVSIVDPFAE